METLELDLDDGAGPGRPAPERSALGWRAHWWVALVGLLVVLSLVFFGLDQQARAREFDDLLDGVTQSQSTFEYSVTRYTAIRQYVSPQLRAPDASAETRTSLQAIVQKTAADGGASLQGRRDAVARLSVRPWHGDQRRARDDYVTYLDGQIGLFRVLAGAQTGSAVYNLPDLSPQLTAAQAALLKVSPDVPSSAKIRTLLPTPEPT